NFYNAMAVRMGNADAAAEVQDRYLAKDYEGAMAALPVEFLDAVALLGPKERIADRMQALAQVGVTTLTVSSMRGDIESGVAALRTAVDALELAGVGCAGLTPRGTCGYVGFCCGDCDPAAACPLQRERGRCARRPFSQDRTRRDRARPGREA